MPELNMELEPIQLKPWQRFWQGFAVALDRGIRALAKRLSDEGVCDAEDDIRCLLMVSDPGQLGDAGEEKLARVRNGRLERPIVAILQGAYESKHWELGPVPLLTKRGTFIRDGADHALLGQFSHSYGVFLERRKESCVAIVRPVRGRDFILRLGKKGGPAFSFGGRSPVAWSTLWDVLGQTAVDPAKVKTVAKAVGLTSITETEDPLSSEALIHIRKYFADIDIGELGKQQLNRRLLRFGLNEVKSSTMSLGLLDSIVQLLLGFSKDKDSPADDGADPSNLRVRLVDDFLQEALDGWLRTLHRRIRSRWKISSDTLRFADALMEANVGRANTSCFTESFRRWTVELPICQRISPDGVNYAAAVTLSRRLTFNGPGGIYIGHEREPRFFKWSHYGRLCPFDTPQSEDVGVTLSLAAGARINDRGQIESQCFAVKDGKVTPEIAWVSPWNEIDGRTGWIAFPDEREALDQGKEVYAHRAVVTMKTVQPDEVTHIHVSENAIISIAASLVPYRAHNDAVRMNMACNFLRQALPLKTASAPRIKTGAEQYLPTKLPFDAGLRDADNRLAFGVDLNVGYLIWKGWNFEDAIVTSESAAETLTSLHFERLEPVRLIRSLAGQEGAYVLATSGAAPDGDFQPARFDSRGIAKKGTVLEPGKPYLLEPSIAWRKQDETKVVPFDYDNRDGHRGPAEVHCVETSDDEDGRGWVRVVLRRARRAQVGDKLANRHGHKGVISRILPDHEMPYVVLNEAEEAGCPCGERRRHIHLQVLINPLSVISRMNLGQLFETKDARDSELAGLPERVECYDPAVEDIGNRKLEDKVFVGTQYVMKLDHNAEDKLHARSTDASAYSAFVQQPLGGRRHNGGQRLGEMEVWALQAHGVPHLLQEMLTLKSDNPWSRRIMLSDIATGERDAEPELPEALRTFTALCYGLGLDLTLMGREEHRLDPASDKLPPDDAAELRIGLLDGEMFTKTVSKGAITTSLISGRNELPGIRFHRDGLESEAIFGPIEDFTCACGAHRFDDSKRSCKKCGTPLLPRRMRRRRMAHIALAKPLPHPFLLFSAPVPFGEDADATYTIAFDPAARDPDTAVILSGLLDRTLRVSFRSRNSTGELKTEFIKGRVTQFVRLCARVSEPFRIAMEHRLHAPILVETPADQVSEFGSQLARKLVGVKLASPQTASHTNIDPPRVALDEAIQRLLPEMAPGLSALAAAGRCGRLVNDLLRKAAECPVDFASKLLESCPTQDSMLLDVLPVIPPDLRRPFKQQRIFQRNDLTVLYLALIYANDDLAHAIKENSDQYPQLRYAQFRAAARLMCNQRLPFSQRAWNPDTRRLRESLSSLLEGKEGLLVGNLLGKRVDFSARAVIVPDPNLSMDTCVLPLELALKLYRPLLLRHLRTQPERDAREMLKKAETELDKTKAELDKANAERLLRHPRMVPDRDSVAVVERAGRGDGEAVKLVSKALGELFGDYWVVLNRQPTLHRLGMLTFKPMLGSGSVISLPAMVTAGFNADFDGDQMAVYLPLTDAARTEAKMMLPSRHLWRPRDGRFALSVAQDIALGSWLIKKGTAAEAASAFEARPADPKLIEDIEVSQKDAFLRATRSGTSISIEDFRALGKRASSGDENDMARILKEDSANGPLGRIVISGARGGPRILSYLAGTEYKPRPGSNLTAGLSLGECLDQAQGGRMRVVDTKLGTAEGGALTKRFVAWSQHIRVTSDNCKTTAGLTITARLAKKGLKRWIYGRVLATDIESLKLKAGMVIGNDAYERIQTWLGGSPERFVIARSPLHCKDSRGVCRACFGMPPWHGLGWPILDPAALAPIGAAVGLIAAQATGEPGTQMALRRKHLAGQAAVEEDIIKLFKDAMDMAYVAFRMCCSGASEVKIDRDEVEAVEQTIGKDEFIDGEDIQGEDGEVMGEIPKSDVTLDDGPTPSASVSSPTQVVEENGVTAIECQLAEVDSFLVEQGIELSIIHLETLIRGRDLSKLAGWIANLAKPGRGFEGRLANSALRAQKDSLMDLRSQTVVGGKAVADGGGRP